ncbi:MAG TPA: hypothetical protein VGD89_11585 [Flavipsychrobacter sp.]
MKRFANAAFTFLFLLLISTTLNAQPIVDSIIVCDITHDIPADCKYLGDVKIKDGMSRENCGYEKKVEEAKRKVMAAGGNILRITLVRYPSTFGRSCYGLSAEAYYTDDMVRTRKQMNIPEDTISKKLISDTAQYALLYFYRIQPPEGPYVTYHTYVNGKKMCAISGDTKCIVKMDKEGPAKISAFLEQNVEKELDIKFGKVYFIRCQAGPGKRYIKPVLTFQHPNKGYYEYSIIPD